MLRISKTGTYSDVIKLYQLLKELFGGDNGLIIRGLDVTTVDSTTLRVTKGKALTPTLDVLELTDHTNYSIFDIQSEKRETTIPDGNHILVFGLTNKQTPTVQLVIEKSVGVFDNFPIDFIALKIVQVTGGVITNLVDSYLDYEVRRITMASDQETGSGGIPITNHNDLSGIQGGNPPDEFFHLSSSEYTLLQDLVNNSYKFLSNSFDTTPGYLGEKIDTNIFEINPSFNLTIKNDAITLNLLAPDIMGYNKNLNAATLGSDQYIPYKNRAINLATASTDKLLWDALEILKNFKRTVRARTGTPDLSVTPNTAYLVSGPAGPSPFSGHDDEIAFLIRSGDNNDENNWIFRKPEDDDFIYVGSERKFYVYNGTNWTEYPLYASGNDQEVQYNQFGMLSSKDTFKFDPTGNILTVTNVRAHYQSSGGNSGVTITFDVQDAWDSGKFWHLVFEDGILVSAVKSSK